MRFYTNKWLRMLLVINQLCSKITKVIKIIKNLYLIIFQIITNFCNLISYMRTHSSI